MKNTIFFMLFLPSILFSQIIPITSDFNQNIVWENIFTQGSSGKVNRGIVDSDGNCAVIFMPENMARIHKIDGNTGELIWSISFDNCVGFGISEFNDAGRVDYIICGGKGSSQERWIARINGNNGSTIWNNTYDYDGNQFEYDGIRMTLTASDNFIYASGFVKGDEPGTIFIVYGGQEMVMKVDPFDGSQVWTNINSVSEYSVSVVESSSGMFYSAGTLYDEDLTITKFDENGNVFWTQSIENTSEIIPADLDISSSDELYYGGHSGRTGEGDPFDYSCISLDTSLNVNWKKHYANPRAYSIEHIRNELYGLKVGTDGIYMFGGTGDEGNYSETNPPFLSSDIWNGWVLSVDWNGAILKSDVYCHEQANTATEYGDLIDNGYVIFNDTDAQGDTEVGVMKIVNGSNTPTSLKEFVQTDNAPKLIAIKDLLFRNVSQQTNTILFYIYENGVVEKKVILK